MKWAIREAIDVYFKAKSVLKLGARTIRAGEPVLIFDTVKTSSFEVAAEVSYVTGGRGNSRILSYEGDKTLTFQFEDALLSAEGLAILAGADLIPARNKNLPGASPEARSVISHYTEKYSVITGNLRDDDVTNTYADDPSLYPASGKEEGFNYPPRGGVMNVWFTRKPYVGQNSSIYVMLLDDAGEMSGAPLEINLNNYGPKQGATETDPEVIAANQKSYLAKWQTGEKFVAFLKSGLPMKVADYAHPEDPDAAGVFDDQVMHYVDLDSAKKYWVTAWGEVADYEREITAANYGDGFASVDADNHYCYLLAPSGGIAQPKCFKEGTSFYYKANVPSILYQDIVLLDYYVEYRHDATQVTILPDKFGPYLYVEGSSLVRRASDGTDLPVEFVIPKFKVTTALTFTLQSTGDPSTFTFQGDAYPDFSKFDLTRKVLADIQILDADDNYDGATGDTAIADPTDYRRYRYSDDSEGEYLWKDPSLEPHSNIDYSDAGYVATEGGPATRTPGSGLITSAEEFVPITP